MIGIGNLTWLDLTVFLGGIIGLCVIAWCLCQFPRDKRR